MFRSAEALLRPKSVALVGASESGGVGRAKRVFDRLVENGRPVPIYLVNPNREELWGQRVYPSFAAIPQAVDLAVVIIPAPAVPAVIADAAAHGVKCALVYGAHFGEDGDAEGLVRAQSIRTLCETRNIRVSGPNCMGSLSVRERLAFYSVPRVRSLKAGPVGVVFQSSGTLQFWLEQAGVRGLGFSYAVTTGNEVDLDLPDYINFLVEDESTRIIACMVEGVRRPDAFMAVAEKALRARKPILVLKSGRSEAGREAAKSHTGVLAGDDAVFDAVCLKYGIVRCLTLDELVEACLAFHPGRFPPGPRIGMVSYSGGLKGLFLDQVAEENTELAQFLPETQEKLSDRIFQGLSPTNPVDCGADLALQTDKFGEVCQLVCSDPGVDLLMIQGHLPTLPNEPMDAAMYRAVRASTDKPVIVFNRMAQNVSEEARRFQEDACVPFLHGVPQALRAAMGLVRYANALRRALPSLPPGSGRPEDLDPTRLDGILAGYGVVAPRSARANTADEAAAVAVDIGFPVALKLVSPSAIHKTEVGGVALNLTSAQAVRAAAVAMVQRLSELHPDAVIERFLVQEMVSGAELIVGVREDPQFGPFMVVGMGGVLVEVLKDFTLRMLPVDEPVASEMLQTLRGSELLGAFRGRPARDVSAAVRAMAGLSRCFLDHRAFLSDLEVNPLIVLPAGQGARAVDVRPIGRRRR